MRLRRSLICLAAVGFAVGCQDRITAPVEQEATGGGFQVVHVDQVRDFIWDWEDSVSCANSGKGEYILWDGILRVHTTGVNTPGGVTVRDNKEVEFLGYNYDDFMGFGQTSGDEWIVDPAGSQWNARKTATGDFESWHQNYKFLLRQDTGEKLVVQGTREWVYDKDGNLVMEYYNNGSCPQVW